MHHHVHHRHLHGRAPNLPREEEPQSVAAIPYFSVPEIAVPSSTGSGFGFGGLMRRECAANDNSAACEKPTGSNTVPIILGACIPLGAAAIVLFFLHQRHLRKLKQEDAMDKTKSMDFGLEIGPASKLPKFSVTDGEKYDGRSRKQLSMEMDMQSPYLLPGQVDSMSSLARTVSQTEDRYGRPQTSYSGAGSVRPPPAASSSNFKRQHERDSSVYTAQNHASMDGELLGDVQNFGASSPPRHQRESIPGIAVPAPAARALSPTGLPTSPRDGQFNPPKSEGGEQSPRMFNGLPPSLQVGTPSPSRQTFADPFMDPETSHAHNESRPASEHELEHSRPLSNDESHYGDDNGIQFRFSTASADDDTKPAESSHPEPQPQEARKSLAPAVALDNRRLSMGFRPLPPEGNPDDTAEQRALRIRSFYKEYFSVEDDNAPPVPSLRQMPQDNNGLYDDTAAIFDPETGRFIMPGAGTKPFAEPPTRRAMTPPPRMPPRFAGPGSDGPRSRSGSMTGGRFMPPGPRAFSSASGRLPPPMRGPRRPIEPPKPLHLMPTPSKLTDDLAYNSPILFAPPQRVVRDGGAESPGLLGGLRPYSPTVQPHVPLASAFEELAHIPSPHALRNSSAFTSLDFAPPPKFKNDGNMSDAGSIRSNQSGRSAMQVHNIRNGAYRVSRLPTDVVPLKDQMANELKPSWDVRHAGV